MKVSEFAGQVRGIPFRQALEHRFAASETLAVVDNGGRRSWTLAPRCSFSC